MRPCFIEIKQVSENFSLIFVVQVRESKIMSLLQGYSSSEEEEEHEPAASSSSSKPITLLSSNNSSRDDVVYEDDADQQKTNSGAASMFPPAPSATRSKTRKRTKLPLLEDIEEPSSSDSDFDFVEEEEATTKKAKVTTGPVEQLHQSETEYVSDLASSSMSKRARMHVDIDEDEEEPIISSIHKSKLHESRKTGAATTSFDPRRFPVYSETSSDQRAIQSSFNSVTDDRTLSQEMNKAASKGAVFAELNSGQIRKEAQKYQQGGITAYLQKSRGVTGRQNQIAYLAQVAMKQKEEGR